MTRYALAGRDEQIHRINPLVQGNVAALEDRPGTHREVFLTLVATVEAVFPFRDALARTADGTARTVRPKATFEVSPGGFWSGNISKSWKVEIVLLDMVNPLIHGEILPQKIEGVKYIIPKKAA